MSLASDFHMYYSGTYVGYRLDSGRVVPFYVHDVIGDSDSYDAEAESSLVFRGLVLKDEVAIDYNVTLGEGRLVLELPELGYVKIGNNWKWLSYRPVHMACKGLTGRRVIGSTVNNACARAVYKAIHEKPDNLARQFHLNQRSLNYKGREVGSNNSEGVISLYPEWKHLVSYAQKVFTTTTVEVLNVSS